MTRFSLALVAALPLAACSGSSSRSETPATDSQSFLAASDGKLLAYRKQGVGDRVLLIPGGSWMSADLGPLSEDRMVISYDPRGRAGSDSLPENAPPTLAQDLADLETVVEWFRLERFSILAMDYQAAVAAIYADQHPEQVERLVLVSPMPIRKTPYHTIYERVFSGRLDSRDFIELREMARLLVPRRDPGAWARAYKRAILTGWVADPDSLEDMRSTPFVEPNLDPERGLRQYTAVLRSLGEWDFREQLGDTKTPTLIVYGALDPVPEESTLEWAECLSAGSAERIDECGRLPWVERPKDFFPLVEGFLDAHAAATAP